MLALTRKELWETMWEDVGEEKSGRRRVLVLLGSQSTNTSEQTYVNKSTLCLQTKRASLIMPLHALHVYSCLLDATIRCKSDVYFRFPCQSVNMRMQQQRPPKTLRHVYHVAKGRQYRSRGSLGRSSLAGAPSMQGRKCLAVIVLANTYSGADAPQHNP